MDLSFLGDFDRCYTYARVSSTEQGDDRRNSIEGQEARLHNVRPKPNIHYRDIQGGDDPTRPDFNRLIAQARSDAFQGLKVVIVVTDQSRLSRGEDAATLIASFDAIEVCVYALDDGQLTTKSPNQWFNVATKGVYNHYFVLQIRARLRAVNDQQRLEGRPVSRRPPYGYKYTREKFIVEPKAFEIARECVLKFLPAPIGEGWSLRRCAAHARSLGWDIEHNGFKAWLKNIAIQGHTEYSIGGHTREEAKQGIYSTHKPKEIRLYTHEPIISHNEYQLILRQLRENKQFARVAPNVPREPLSGLIYCQSCGRGMHYATVTEKKSGERYHNYSCKAPKCQHRISISVRTLEPQIQQKLADRAAQIAQAVQNTAPATEIDTDVIKWTEQIEDLQKIYDRNPMPGIRQSIEDLQRQITEKAKTPVDQSADLQESIQMFADPDNFNLLDKPQKRLVYRELVKRVTVGRSYHRGPVSVEIELWL